MPGPYINRRMLAPGIVRNASTGRVNVRLHREGAPGYKVFAAGKATSKGAAAFVKGPGYPCLPGIP